MKLYFFKNQILSLFINDRFPAFHLGEEEIAVHEDNAGVLNPELCINTHIALAEDHGAEAHYDEKLLSYHRVETVDGEELIEVVTSQSVYHTKKLALTVGAWAPEIYGTDISVPLTIERATMFWFQPIEGSTINWQVSEPINHYNYHFLQNNYQYDDRNSQCISGSEVLQIASTDSLRILRHYLAR